MSIIDRVLVAVLAVGVWTAAIGPDPVLRTAKADHYFVPETTDDLEDFVFSVLTEWCWVDTEDFGPWWVLHRRDAPAAP